MKQKGFIFIPGINNFISFVISIELAYSRPFIKDLHEVILKSNQMDLKVSEVEGTAILFCQIGEIPDLEIVSAKVQRIFLLYHKERTLHAFFETTKTCSAIIFKIRTQV